MCMRQTQVRPYHRWNWHGDEICYKPIIPASRSLPNGRKTRGYPIDVREFLSTEGNAVIANWMGTLVESLPPAKAACFHSHQRGSFDFRKACVARSLSTLRYIPRRSTGQNRVFDDWLFPEETAAIGGGDCEDISFLLAALLEASGISPDCIRVAFGTLTEHDHGRAAAHDHTWVMYQNEQGVWEILDPLEAVHRRPHHDPARRTGRALLLQAAKLADVEYIPSFVVNRHHLWNVRSSGERRTLVDALGRRKFWKEFDPSFAAKVHGGIIDEALGGGQTPLDPDQIAALKRASLWVDVNVLAYDPRDHFDFSYVEESWRRYQDRLREPGLSDFALAAHAIADLYAHTVYAEFAPRRPDGTIALYDPDRFDASHLRYDFAPYAPLPGASRPVNQCSALWAGKLISGQWWRWYTTFPDDLGDRRDLKDHRCLPDHDLLAVDGPSPATDPRHRYFSSWDEQFQLRRAAAVEHVRAAYKAWSPSLREEVLAAAPG